LILNGDDGIKKNEKNDEKTFLIPGIRQAHRNCKNINKLNREQKLVGDGVYCSPFPKVMDTYAKRYEGYKMALMLRVKPQRIRYCKCEPEGEKSSYWVLNGKSNEMRPYRILLKK
jgi:hypothetical protein